MQVCTIYETPVHEACTAALGEALSTARKAWQSAAQVVQVDFELDKVSEDDRSKAWAALIESLRD